jgi:hypothetical protein
MWHPVAHNQVPKDCDLRLAVIHGREVHALVFPCRKTDAGWVNARTRRMVEVSPTHWQPWSGTDVGPRLFTDGNGELSHAK